jgi:hypothetical protein
MGRLNFALELKSVGEAMALRSLTSPGIPEDLADPISLSFV